MSDFRADDHNPEGCPGCRPVVFDQKTGKVEEAMTAIAGEVFDAASPDQRKAWHRVTCLNSRDLIDLMLAKKIGDGIMKRARH
jgi:hypothetical protein